ncbi:glycosyltransferase family 61 protein [Acetobacter thailandicus]|uniref:glycosyltransferase family 61 protein n=1 Tax=Acetobacter thailandicus TaxID=1502842 RepID=UPI001BA91415|nr:glycosyltransferase family 61 protein [Acetobacter thailandicus]MBS0987028.1 glycosyltransferase family 61 protein [Acetobacter thailandicus]
MLKKSKISSAMAHNFYDSPDINVHHDAIFMPGFNYNDNQFGIFSREGYLITQAAFFHQYPSTLKNQPISINPNIAKSIPQIESAIFVGHPHPQYGHFITEFVSRLWSLKKIRKNNEKLLLRSLVDIEDLYNIPWFAEFMGILKLSVSDFIVPKNPIIVKKLYVPSPAFSEEGYCYYEMAKFCNEIGDSVAFHFGKNEFYQNENIYLSRHNIKNGTIKIENEFDLVECLRKTGFKILNPEELNVSQQIMTFRNKNFVVGMLGSAFHTSIFSNSPQGIAINAKDSVLDASKGYPAPSLNYLAMDGVNNSSFDYFDLNGVFNSENQDSNYLITRTLKNPQNIADYLYNRAIERRRNFTIPNMGRFGKCDVLSLKIFKILDHEKKSLKFDTRTGFTETKSGKNNIEVYIFNVKGSIYDGVNLIISSDKDATSFKINNTQLFGPAAPVKIENIEKNLVSIKSLENDLYISSEGSIVGESWKSTAENVDTWEKFQLVSYEISNIDQSSRLAVFLSIILLIFDEKVIGNMEYYINKYKEFVIFSYLLKRFF